MRKAILFPFKKNQDNYSRYLLTMEMARETSLPVVCFSAVPEYSTEKELDQLYLHLLDLNGYYQTFINSWKPIKTKVKKVIRRGDFRKELCRFLESSECEWIVLEKPEEA